MTIKELSDELKVSRATIYRVLNNHPYVTEDVRRLVLESIEKYGCAPNKTGKALALRKKNLKITVIIKERADSFYADICTGISNAFSAIKDTGIEVEIKETFSTSPQRELKMLEELQNSHTTAVVAALPQSPEVVEAVNRLVDSGIQVATYSTDLAGSRRLFFVGQDDYKSGRIVGEILLKMFSGIGKVALCAGLAHNECHRQRAEGIKAYIRENCPHMACVEVPDNGHDDQVAYQHCAAMLRVHPDVGAMVVISRGIGGAVRALKECGLQNKVKMIAFDLTPDNRSYQREGIVDVLINQNPIRQGERIIETLYDYLANGKPPAVDTIYTDTQIVLREMLEG